MKITYKLTNDVCAMYNIDVGDINVFVQTNYMSLTMFICHDNNLSSLPKLLSLAPLTELQCHNNQLTELIDLPETLKLLSCSGNKLKKLPTLPPNLVNLFCHFNQLTELPPLPFTLVTLYCYDNHLRELPDLKSVPYLNCLFCENNHIMGINEMDLSNIRRLRISNQTPTESLCSIL